MQLFKFKNDELIFGCGVFSKHLLRNERTARNRRPELFVVAAFMPVFKQQTQFLLLDEINETR